MDNISASLLPDAPNIAETSPYGVLEPLGQAVIFVNTFCPCFAPFTLDSGIMISTPILLLSGIRTASFRDIRNSPTKRTLSLFMTSTTIPSSREDPSFMIFILT